VREAFPGYEVEFKNSSRSSQLERPFRITFPPLKEQEAAAGGKAAKRKAAEAAGGDDTAAEAAAPERKLLVESYTPVDPGPYPQDLPPQNTVRFTPVQTQAIMSGVQPGLTMVVGPPGVLVCACICEQLMGYTLLRITAGRLIGL
jgi:intron-binding protein aquarius